MRKNTFRITTALVLMLIATLGSCVKGEKGDIGPQGATGATGASGTNGTNGQDGDTGPQGPQGATGADGNANVKTGTVLINPSSWNWNAPTLSNYVNINDPDITASIVSSGMVSVFFSTSSGTWIALPTTTYSGSTLINYGYGYSLSTVTISVTSSSGTSLTFNPITFKVVAIASSIRKANPNTDWNNYEQVQKIIDKEMQQSSCILNSVSK